MNVLVCFSHSWNGARAYGAEMQTGSLIQALRDKGHTVVLAAAEGSQKSGSSAGNIGPDYELPFQSSNPLDWIRVNNHLAEIAAQHRIEIVHAQHRSAGYHAEILFRRKRIPYVVTVHDLWRSAPLKRLHGHFLRRAIAVSDFIRDSTIRKFRIAGELVRTIHNGVDPSRFSTVDRQRIEAFRNRYGLQAEPVISVIARISKAKGQADLLRALKLLGRFDQKYKCLIVGEGKFEPKLAQMAAELGLEDTVVFCGYQPHISTVIHSSDVIVLPSRQEPFGLVVVEAMLSGKPVIGANDGAIPEIITHDCDGLLYAAGDVGALADAMALLLRNGELQKRLAQQGYATAIERFSLGHMVEKTEKYYSEILSS